VSLTTIEIKEAIYSEIAAVATTYESGRVDKDATFPYAVYALGDSLEGQVDQEDSIRYPLDIDVYDKDMDKDTTAIENLADDIDAALNRQHHLGDGFYIFFVRQSKHPNFPTPDEYTFRRNLRYEAKVYKESDS
jgi:hypothetical protein